MKCSNVVFHKIRITNPATVLPINLRWTKGLIQDLELRPVIWKLSIYKIKYHFENKIPSSLRVDRKWACAALLSVDFIIIIIIINYTDHQSIIVPFSKQQKDGFKQPYISMSLCCKQDYPNTLCHHLINPVTQLSLSLSDIRFRCYSIIWAKHNLPIQQKVSINCVLRIYRDI